MAGILLSGLTVGCDRGDDGYDGMVAIYRVRGTVVEDNGQPVAGIGTGCWNLYENEHQYVYYADTTDASGLFLMEHIESQPIDTTIAIAFSDLDGELNGTFADTVVAVHFLKCELQGGSDGVYGEAEKEITVVLRTTNLY